MKNHFTIRPNLTVAAVALLLSACASEPVPVAGSRTRGRSCPVRRTNAERKPRFGKLGR